MFDIPRGLSRHWRQSHHRTGAATLIKIHQGVASFQNSVLQAPRGHRCPEVRAGVITPPKRGCESIGACTSRHSVPTHCGTLPLMNMEYTDGKTEVGFREAVSTRSPMLGGPLVIQFFGGHLCSSN